MTRPLEVVYRPVDALVPDPRNARTHPKRQLDQIVASIRQFGFTNPILVDAAAAVIAGHGRLLAAKAIGLADVPTILLADLTAAQKRALRLADNKIALGAGWDLDLLKLELGELSTLDIDLDLTGFSTGEIDVILNAPGDPDDEVIPLPPETPRTKPGDIWVLGEHRIGCGDGRDADFLKAVIGDDARIDAAFRSFLADTLRACARVSRDGPVHFVCMDAALIAEMKELADQNRRPKKMYAEMSMQNDLLKEALGKKR